MHPDTSAAVVLSLRAHQGFTGLYPCGFVSMSDLVLVYKVDNINQSHIVAMSKMGAIADIRADVRVAG